MDMKIREIEAFDLYGDGTLVLKTNLESTEERVQYAWYVKKGDRNIFKGSYQGKPFMAYKISAPGAYTIKAFVKNKDGEKTEETITFVADRNTSPQLSAAKELSVKGRPAVEHISGTRCPYRWNCPKTLFSHGTSTATVKQSRLPAECIRIPPNTSTPFRSRGNTTRKRLSLWAKRKRL